MSKYQKGFGLVVVMVFITMANLLMFKNANHLNALYGAWVQWRKPKNTFQEHLAQWTLLQKEPCLLLCHKKCLSSELWKGEYEAWVVYRLQALKKNECLQKNPLKVYHPYVSWRFVHNL